MPPAPNRRASAASPPEDPTAAASRSGAAGSPSSSTVSSVADWVADPGPDFDAGQAAEDAAGRDEERAFTVGPGQQGELLDVEWDPKVVRGLLEAQGSALHSLAGKGEDDWIYLRHELDAIAPAATRILNRYDTSRMAAATGDELALLVGLTGYTVRSLQVRKRALDAQRAAEEGPAPADPLTMPPLHNPNEVP